VQREEKYKYWDELKKAAELPAEKVVEERSAVRAPDINPQKYK
jgi:hypothetical protein